LFVKSTAISFISSLNINYTKFRKKSRILIRVIYNSYINMKSIEFTDNELNILVQLLDIAVKAQGLNVAEAAVILARKVAEVGGAEESPEYAEPTVVPTEEEEGE